MRKARKRTTFAMERCTARQKPQHSDDTAGTASATASSEGPARELNVPQRQDASKKDPSWRPEVPVRHVQPTLAGWAHNVVPSPNPQVRGSIFLGPQWAAEGTHQVRTAFRSLRVGAVVNCTPDVPNAHEQREGNGRDKWHVSYCCVGVRDNPGADLLVWFRPVAEFMERHLSQGTSVLVHCHHGVSRSPSVVIAHQMIYAGQSRDDAYFAIKSVRQQVKPNAGFWHQLGVLEQQLSSVSHAEGITPPLGATEHAETWIKASRPNFAALGHARLHHMSPPAANEAAEAALSDMFARGRGFRRHDLEWLIAVCDAVKGAASAARELLKPESEFLESWSGEFAESDIQALLRALPAVISERSATE